MKYELLDSSAYDIPDTKHRSLRYTNLKIWEQETSDVVKSEIIKRVNVLKGLALDVDRFDSMLYVQSVLYVDCAREGVDIRKFTLNMGKYEKGREVSLDFSVAETANGVDVSWMRDYKVTWSRGRIDEEDSSYMIKLLGGASMFHRPITEEPRGSKKGVWLDFLDDVHGFTMYRAQQMLDDLDIYIDNLNDYQ